MICAVVFDLDGVLFDTEPLQRRAWMEAMRTFGHKIEERSLIRWTGIPCRDLARYYEVHLDPRVDWREYHRVKGERLRSIIASELMPYPGMIDAVRELASIVPCGYATSNHRIDAELMLDVSGFSGFFSAGVTYDDVPRHKPEPDPYLTVARSIGVDPVACAAVEDSPSGVASARRAGMVVVAVRTTFGEESLSTADRIFDRSIDACRWLIKTAAGNAKSRLPDVGSIDDGAFA